MSHKLEVRLQREQRLVLRTMDVLRACLLIAACSACRGEKRASTRLQVVRTWIVPARFEVAAVTRSGDRIAAFEHHSRRILVLDGDSVRSVFSAKEGTVVGLRWLPQESALEVVTSAPATIQRFGTRGDLRGARRLPIAETILQAQFAAGRWWISDAPDSVTYRIRGIFADLAGSTELYRTRISQHLGTVPVDWLRFSAMDSTILLTQRVWPFGVTSLAIDSRQHADLPVQAGLRPSALDAAGIPSGDFGWASLPALRFGDHFIQTISHLQSDRRFLLLVHSKSRTAKILHFDAPMGFVETDARTSTVVAVRKLDVQEVVVYQVIGLTDELH